MVEEASESLRARRKRETRTEIQDVALRLAMSAPLAELTVARISAEAGISPRTFFRYFDSKEAAILPGTAEMQQILSSLSLNPGTPREVFDQILTHFENSLETAYLPHRHEHRQVSQLLEREPTLTRYLGAQEMQFVSDTMTIIENQTGLEFYESGVVAESALALWRTTWREWGRHAEHDNAPQVAHVFARTREAFSGLFR